jgi:phosphatidylethanolamine-binding protein (PEBP) family uncharacterized protein
MLHLLRRQFALLASAAVTHAMLPASALAQQTNPTWNGLKLGSTTFGNNTFLPISTIHNLVKNDVYVCPIDGTPGGNQSPELCWTGALPNTHAFVVVAYDVTAAVTHWGMYDISGHATGRRYRR